MNRARADLKSAQVEMFTKLESDQDQQRARLEEQAHAFERRMSDEAHALARERADFEKDSRSVRKRLDADVKQFESLRARHGDLEAELAALNREIDLRALAAKEAMSAEEHRLRTIRDEIKEKESLLSSLIETTKQSAAAESELAALKADLQRTEKQQHQEGLAAAQRAHDRDMVTQNQHQARVAALEKQFKEQSTSLERNLSDKQAALKAVTADTAAAQRELAALLANVEHARESVREYQVQQQKFELSVRDLRAQVEDNERRNDAVLSEMQRESERRRAALDRMEREIAQVRHRRVRRRG
jgi:chromosome segregation ATPase